MRKVGGGQKNGNNRKIYITDSDKYLTKPGGGGGVSIKG